MGHPTSRQFAHAVKVVARLAGARRAVYCFGNRAKVPVGEGWSLAISPDDAGRFRVEACHSDRVRATMWCRADDDDRLAELVSAARTEVAALAA
jgi:hypothetical protein